MIPWLERDDPFPPLASALRHPNGLLAAGADLSPERLLAAYRQGIFPWYSDGEPILWWSPDPRMVLIPTELKISRSLAKTLRNRRYEIRFDSAFAAVMQGCASRGDDHAAPSTGETGTWITADMRAAYQRLHELGYAHSVETWIEGELAGGLYGVAIGRMFYGESMFTRVRDASKMAMVHLVRRLERQGCCRSEGELAGGLYGVAIGRMFYGESMFTRVRDASKMAMVHLVRRLERQGCGMIDCQMHTRHLATLGA